MSDSELREAMILHSATHPGCWVASVLPFGGGATLIAYPNAAKIPDEFVSSQTMIERGYAQDGKLKPFLKSQLLREQNRGYSDR